MAKRSIYFPEELERRMAEFPEENWSSVCQQAVEAHLQKIQLRSKMMMTVVERAAARLKLSKAEYVNEAQERGRAAGAEWAADDATYGQLKALADSGADDFETNDALGPPGIFVRIVDDDFIGRASLEDFWQNLGYDLHDDDLYAADFWAGFAEGALEVFEKADV
jgi:hypothetical protein